MANRDSGPAPSVTSALSGSPAQASVTSPPSQAPAASPAAPAVSLASALSGAPAQATAAPASGDAGGCDYESIVAPIKRGYAACTPPGVTNINDVLKCFNQWLATQPGYKFEQTEANLEDLDRRLRLARPQCAPDGDADGEGNECDTTTFLNLEVTARLHQMDFYEDHKYSKWRRCLSTGQTPDVIAAQAEPFKCSSDSDCVFFVSHHDSLPDSYQALKTANKDTARKKAISGPPQIPVVGCEANGVCDNKIYTVSVSSCLKREAQCHSIADTNIKSCRYRRRSGKWASSFSSESLALPKIKNIEEIARDCKGLEKWEARPACVRSKMQKEAAGLCKEKIELDSCIKLYLPKCYDSNCGQGLAGLDSECYEPERTRIDACHNRIRLMLSNPHTLKELKNLCPSPSPLKTLYPEFFGADPDQLFKAVFPEDYSAPAEPAASAAPGTSQE